MPRLICGNKFIFSVLNDFFCCSILKTFARYNGQHSPLAVADVGCCLMSVGYWLLSVVCCMLATCVSTICMRRESKQSVRPATAALMCWLNGYTMSIQPLGKQKSVCSAAIPAPAAAPAPAIRPGSHGVRSIVVCINYKLRAGRIIPGFIGPSPTSRKATWNFN